MIVPRPLPPTIETLVDGLYVRTSDWETSVDPNNKAARVDEVVLFVERILPPMDHRVEGPGELHGTILWRVSAYRRQDAFLKYFIATEKDIVALVENRVKTASQDSDLR